MLVRLSWWIRNWELDARGRVIIIYFPTVPSWAIESKRENGLFPIQQATLLLIYLYPRTAREISCQKSQDAWRCTVGRGPTSILLFRHLFTPWVSNPWPRHFESLRIAWSRSHLQIPGIVILVVRSIWIESWRHVTVGAAQGWQYLCPS